MTTPREPLLFLSHSGHRSGAEKVMLDLVAEARRRGHPVAVACPGGALVEALPEGVRRVAVPRLGLSGQTGARRVLALLGLALAWLRAAAVLRLETRRHPGTRLVVNSLMATPVLRVARLRGSWLVHDTVAEGRQRMAVRVAAPAVARAVAVSGPTAAALEGTGLDVVVRPNGIDLPAPTAHGSGDARTAPTVGILSALTPWKGHRLLLEAVATLPQVRLEVTGTGFDGEEWYGEELLARAAEPDLEGRVRLLGHVATYDALDGWDLLVSCSELPEAGPLCVLEAMAAGVPVVATTRAAYADPAVCTVVAPDDAAALAAGIRAALAEPEDRRAERLDAARRLVAERHDLARTAPAMLDALLEWS